jgi:hypothetical protein
MMLGYLDEYVADEPSSGMVSLSPEPIAEALARGSRADRRA